MEIDLSPPTPLSLVEMPSIQEAAGKLRALQDAHRVVVERAWIGALVTGLTNDELRVLADSYLSIGDVQTLRRLGVLGPDEGFDGYDSRRRR